MAFSYTCITPSFGFWAPASTGNNSDAGYNCATGQQWFFEDTTLSLNAFQMQHELSTRGITTQAELLTLLDGPELGITTEEIATAWGAGFITCLPVLLVVWGGRRVLELLFTRH